MVAVRSYKRFLWAGLSYTLDYAEAKQPQDEVVNQDGVTIFIDKKAQLSILGTEMDFQESKYGSIYIKHRFSNCPFPDWLQNLSSTTLI